MSDKRYQIFISSTFEDLKEERRSVIRAILEMDHIPAGMELFPASDENAWTLIKDVIKKSDYYVIIIGGRYGSLNSSGISYTETEYDFAMKTGLPIIPLLHKNPDNLPRGKTDTDEKSWKKLQDFRSKVENNHTCKFWESAEDLGAKLIIGITSNIKRHPRIGWIRADELPSIETLQKLEEARDRISYLEKSLEDAISGPPQGTENLASGQEKISIKFKDDSLISTNKVDNVMYTWDELFNILGPHMMREVREYQLTNAIRENIVEKKGINSDDSYHIKINDEDFQAIKIQLLALGLIQKSKIKHTPSDTSTYWSLTLYGESYLLKLKAITSNKSKKA